MANKLLITQSIINSVCGNTLFVPFVDNELQLLVSPLVITYEILKHYRTTETGDIYIFQTTKLLTLISESFMVTHLGNLAIEEIEARVGFTFSKELKTFLSERKEESASNIQPGKWQCFDIPFISSKQQNY